MTSDIPPTLRMASESPDQPRETGSAGPGRTIRQARERVHLSLEELAKETRLARATLEALERDDFSTLTEPVYVRGYYRKCAKVLNLPENELISSYDKLFAPKTPTIPTKLLLSNGESMSPSGRRGGSGGIVATVVVAAVLTSGLWFVINDPSRFGFGEAPGTATGTSEAVASTPAPAPIALPPPSPIDPSAITTTTDAAGTAPAAGAGDTPVSGAPTNALATPTATLNLDATLSPPTGPSTAAAPPAPAPIASTPASTAPASPPISASTVAATAASPAAPAATSGSLVLSFKSSSWVRIEDADGRVLLSGTIQAGDRQQLSGRPPYALFLGYAPGVSVEFNGNAIDTTPFVRQNSTARVSVPLPPNPVPATATQ